MMEKESTVIGGNNFFWSSTWAVPIIFTFLEGTFTFFITWTKWNTTWTRILSKAVIWPCSNHIYEIIGVSPSLAETHMLPQSEISHQPVYAAKFRWRWLRLSYPINFFTTPRVSFLCSLFEGKKISHVNDRMLARQLTGR